MSFFRDQLEKHSMLMLLASFSGHAGNYLYHTLSGRFLSVSDYGLLTASLGLLQISTLPLQAFSLSLAAQSARRPAVAAPLLHLWTRRILHLSPALLLVTLLSASATGHSPLLAFLLTPVFIAGALLSLQGGLLQGLQRFSWMAVRAVCLFSGRALLLGLLLLMGARSGAGALAAHGLAVLLTLWVSRKGLHRLPDSAAATAPAVLRESLRGFPALAGFAVLMSADVVLARLLWDPETAGRFAQAAIPARMILWLPLPIASALFPKIAVTDPASTLVFRKAILYTLLLLFGAWAACMLFPALPLRILYGPPDAAGHPVDWLRGMATAMAPLGFAHLLLQSALARGQSTHLFLLPLLAAIYLVAASRFAENPETLIALLTGLSWLAAAGLTAGLFVPPPPPKVSADN